MLRWLGVFSASLLSRLLSIAEVEGRRGWRGHAPSSKPSFDPLLCHRPVGLKIAPILIVNLVLRRHREPCGAYTCCGFPQLPGGSQGECSINPSRHSASSARKQPRVIPLQLTGKIVSRCTPVSLSSPGVLIEPSRQRRCKPASNCWTNAVPPTRSVTAIFLPTQRGLPQVPWTPEVQFTSARARDWAPMGSTDGFISTMASGDEREAARWLAVATQRGIENPGSAVELARSGQPLSITYITRSAFE